MSTNTVSAQAILEAMPGETPEELPALKKAGMKIVLGIGLFAAAALIPLIWTWIAHTPAAIVVPAAGSIGSQTASQTAQAVEMYRLASQAAAQQPLAWFEALFVKLLYPLLTLVLGYVFGAAAKDSEG